jgi:hypothetical protein
VQYSANIVNKNYFQNIWKMDFIATVFLSPFTAGRRPSKSSASAGEFGIGKYFQKI